MGCKLELGSKRYKDLKGGQPVRCLPERTAHNAVFGRHVTDASQVACVLSDQNASKLSLSLQSHGRTTLCWLEEGTACVKRSYSAGLTSSCAKSE